MEEFVYLIIYGKNLVRNSQCYKETYISMSELNEYNDIFTLINSNKNETNWAWGINIIKTKDNKYEEDWDIFKMYPTINKDKLKKFIKILPEGITKIESVKMYIGSKYKII